MSCPPSERSVSCEGRRGAFAVRRPPEGGPSQGFTLLELILAMLLMGLAVAVSYPTLSRGSASLELRAAGRDVLNIFRYAREKAITEGAGSRVVVERESGRITLA